MAELKQELIKILKDWTKPRTVFTFMFYSTLCYMILRGISIPDLLNTIVSTLFGYWFGSKTTQPIKNGE